MLHPRFALRLLLVLLVACSAKTKPVATPAPPPGSTEAIAPIERPAPAPTGGPWVQTMYADHFLVGRIWRASDGSFVTEDELVEALKAADWRLLGEKHDNADHHRLQARMIEALAPTGVAFEQIDDGDEVGEPADAAALAESVGWADSGWPAFEMYAPVFTATLGAGAKVLPGHPTREQLMGSAREGRDSLGDALEGLPLDRPLSEAQRQDLADEVVASHCGHADEATVEMMIGLQVLKDAWMARAMTRQGAGAVLVAGNGHTRRDRGVPHYLDGGTLTLSFREVSDGEQDPREYEPHADFVWFTPRVDDEDPCEAFKESLEKMGSHGDDE